MNKENDNLNWKNVMLSIRVLLGYNSYCFVKIYVFSLGGGVKKTLFLFSESNIRKKSKTLLKVLYWLENSIQISGQYIHK